MANISQKPEDQVLAAHKGQPVIIFTDFHTITDIVTATAIATAEKTARPLHLESMASHHKVFIDALKAGEISKPKFIELFTMDLGGAPEIGTPAYYMGKERDIKLVEIIADAIVRGVDIVPLGTNLGFSNKTDTIEKADLFDRLNYLRAFIFHRSELFAKQEQPIIQHDPQGYYEALHARVMDKFEKLDPLQKAALSDVMGGYFSGSESYESAAKNMHEILMPEWVEKEKTDRALLSIWKKDREATRLGKSDEAPSGMHERFSQDSNLAQKIKDKIRLIVILVALLLFMVVTIR